MVSSPGPMRVSELSRATGASIATIKYYLREGILPRGTSTAPNQITYGAEHVRRLRLIRVLREVGALGISEIRAVVRAISDEKLGPHEMIGVAQYALGPAPPQRPLTDDELQARADVDGFLTSLKWRVTRDAPARQMLADALVGLRRLGQDVTTDLFAPYAHTASELAQWELDQVRAEGSRSATVESVVVGTVVFETVLIALRRLAHEHYSASRFRRRRRGKYSTRN